MKRYIALLLLFFSVNAVAQSYQELSEQGLAWAEQDSLERAEQTFRQALRLEPANPHNALLFSNIGSLQLRMGKYESAIESYTLALNIAPRVVTILLNRANAYMTIGMANRAYVDYCEVLDLDRKNTEALLMRAYIYVTRRDYSAARIDYDRLLEFEPAHYSARLGLAILNQKEGKYKDALEIIAKMMGDFPKDAVLYTTRAGVELEMEQYELALIDLDEAIRLDPNGVEAYLTRGEIYLLQKKKAQAKADFEKAITLGVPPAEVREFLRQCK